MQSNKRSATDNRPHGAVFMDTAKRVFSSPLLMIFFAASALFLVLCLVSCFVEGTPFLLPGKKVIAFCLSGGPWRKMLGGMLAMAFASGLAMVIGLFLIRYSVIQKDYGRLCTVGCYITKITAFAVNCVMTVLLPLIAIRLIVEVGRRYAGQSGTIVLGIVAILAVIIYFFAFNFKTVIAASLIKESVVGRSPISHGFFSTGLGWIIFGIASLIFQLKWFKIGFNVTLLIGCVCAVLFGLFLINYGRANKAIEIEE